MTDEPDVEDMDREALERLARAQARKINHLEEDVERLRRKIDGMTSIQEAESVR